MEFVIPWPNGTSGYKFQAKCLTIATLAKITQQILNQIIVGIVFIVDVTINARLDARAKR